MKITSVLKYFVVLLISITSNILAAEENILTGSAYYLERILLPENAVFEATLEDVSLMDVPAVILGSVTIEPAGQIPIYFAIKYNADDIKRGHHYNVRGKITVDGKLKFITETMHPVLSRKDSGELKLKMIRLQTAKKKK